MSEPTVSSMHDARDAEDKRLLEAKAHTQLLENYVYLVQEWVAVRVRDRQAWTGSSSVRPGATEPTDIPVGRFAVLQDPAGAVFQVIAPPAQN